MKDHDHPPVETPSGPKYGPARKAPAFYAGETYGTVKVKTPSGATGRVPRRIQYPDVERHPNGALPATRNKFARRLIRKGLKETFSSVTKSLRLARGLRVQAYDASKDDQPKGAKRGRWARRLLAKELAIHTPVYVPTQKELRAMRTTKRFRARKGEKGDAISQLVDRMSEQKP